MSDTKLRELERRWRNTGADEDEAAYLLQRVRAGRLSAERLELAALCDHVAARMAHGAAVRLTFREWMRDARRLAETAGCGGLVSVAVARLAATYARRAGKGGRGPCGLNSLRSIVEWARAEGASTTEIKLEVAAAALGAQQDRRVRGGEQ